MMKSLYYWTNLSRRLLPFLLCLISISLFSQDNRFSASALVGTTFAQINGDNHAGYDKFGFTGGLRGEVILTERFRLSMGLLYSQRGAKSTDIPSFRINQSRIKKPLDIRLNYVEVPVLFNFMASQNWEGRYLLQLQAGISYSRLINNTVEEVLYPNLDDIVFAELAEDFSKNDLGIIFGVAFYLTERFSLGVRHQYSLNALYESDTPEETNSSRGGVSKLNGYFFSLQAMYTFL